MPARRRRWRRTSRCRSAGACGSVVDAPMPPRLQHLMRASAPIPYFLLSSALDRHAAEHVLALERQAHVLVVARGIERVGKIAVWIDDAGVERLRPRRECHVTGIAG